MLESRGNAPRLYRNTLVFLAVDKTRLQDLDEAARRYLAWQSILDESDRLDLSPHQVRQAEQQKSAADGTVASRIPEAYQWLLVPIQQSPQSPVEWQSTRLTGQDALAVRAAAKLRKDELLLTTFAATRLQMELDRVPLWRGDHVAIKQLAEDFARYSYLPRLKDPMVLVQAARDGVALVTWEQDGFAYADSFDEAAGRYRGLRMAQHPPIADADSPGLLVRPEVARRQLEAETRPGPDGAPPPAPTRETTPRGEGEPPLPTSPSEPPRPKRFHGNVPLDPARVGRDASRIADEVIAHLAGLVNAKVKVTLEIEAEIPAGAPDNVVRTVTENSRTLKFTSQGFETE